MYRWSTLHDFFIFSLLMNQIFPRIRWLNFTQGSLSSPVYRQFNNVGFHDGQGLVVFVVDENKEQNQGDDGQHQHKNPHEQPTIGMGTVNRVMVTGLASNIC